MSAIYDLMLLLDPEAPDETRTKILTDVRAAIESQGAIVGDHDWGTRAMAYEIRHKSNAEYHLLQFTGPVELLAQLDRSLRIADGVTRFRIVKMRPGTPPPPEVTAAPVAPAPPAEPVSG